MMQRLLTRSCAPVNHFELPIRRLHVDQISQGLVVRCDVVLEDNGADLRGVLDRVGNLLDTRSLTFMFEMGSYGAFDRLIDMPMCIVEIARYDYDPVAKAQAEYM